MVTTFLFKSVTKSLFTDNLRFAHDLKHLSAWNNLKEHQDAFYTRFRPVEAKYNKTTLLKKTKSSYI